MSFPFTHLRVHSDYSLGTGTSKAKELIKRAKALRQPALALTDVRNLHGALQFSKAAAGEGIQPIIGVQIYIKVGDKGSSGSLLLLAQNEVGYANLCHIHNLSIQRARKPELCLDNTAWGEIYDLEQKGQSVTEGIIAIGGVGADGFVAKAMQAQLPDPELLKFVKFVARRFPGRFYMEICRNGYPEGYDALNERRALEIARDLGLPIIATTDVWYADESRHDSYEILRAVGAETVSMIDVDDDGLVNPSKRRYHLRGSDEMLSLFDDLPEAFQNACTIARRIAFKVDGRKPVLPPFPTAAGRTEDEEMRDQSRAGLEERFARHGVPEERRQQYRDRLEYELGVIEKMGFPGYFLIVSDFIKWSKSQGIPVGPGRGSGAGSVVAWSLTITDLDPLRFGLLFERFLNPERVSMPDFDIDFCQDRREEVIDYVRDKYGDERVAQIVTFQEIKSKTALKDAARVVSTPYGAMKPFESNNLTALIPNKEGAAEPMGLQEAYEKNNDFRKAIDSSDIAKHIIRQATRIEGLYRNAGAHAAGVVIGRETLTKLVPVGYDPKKGGAVVQFNMKDVETAGLVKFDFLGLKTLSVIREAVELIKGTTGEDIDIANVPYEDPAVYEMLSEGLSNGVFQLESDGMKRVLRQIRPTSIEDLIAIVSLFRPGPMEMIPTYADHKSEAERTGQHQDQWYPEPVEQTKRFLGETYGIMVYQEQVMQVAQVVAGYSLGGADLLRRAMGKKIKAEMDAQKEQFIKGAEANGTPPKKASELFDLIEKFSGYGFNKSHAAAYAAVTFQTAWLKKHYPAQFFAALLSYETDKPEKMSLIKGDMTFFDIELLPPDINASAMRFLPEQKPDGKWAVRFGLTAIKQVTNNPEFMRDRKAKGPFRDLIDFNQRVGHLFSSSHLLKMCEAGAFASITPGGVRKRAFGILQFLAKAAKGKDTNTNDIFSGSADAGIVIPRKELEAEEWNEVEVKEFGAVGFYFKDHPLDMREQKMAVSGGVRTRAAIAEYMTQRRLGDFDNRKLRGMVEASNIEAGSEGRSPRLRLKLAEKSDSYWINIFPSRDRDIKKLADVLAGAKTGRMPVVVLAKFVARDEGFSIYGNAVYTDEEYATQITSGNTLEILVDTSRLDLTRYPKIAATMMQLAEQAERIDANPSQLLAEAAEAFQPRMVSLVENIHKVLTENETKEGGQPVAIRLINRIGSFKSVKTIGLPGRFKLDGMTRNLLSNMNGIAQIVETETEETGEVPDQAIAPPVDDRAQSENEYLRHVYDAEEPEFA